jgi:preprotein translocase subunit YajC
MISLTPHVLILAQAAGSAAPTGLGNPLWMFVIMIVMMYFIAIRPQQKRMKEHQALVASAKVGDHVVMECGVHGIITSIKERTVMVKIADNVKVEYERGKIAAVSKKSDVVEAQTA